MAKNNTHEIVTANIQHCATLGLLKIDEMRGVGARIKRGVLNKCCDHRLWRGSAESGKIRAKRKYFAIFSNHSTKKTFRRMSCTSNQN